MTKTLFAVAAVVSPLLLAGCDDTDQARITELEGELATSREQIASLETSTGELETLRAENVELQRQLEAAPAGQSANTEAMQQPLITATQALQETDDQLTQLEEALAAEGFDEVSLAPVRENLLTVAESLASVASEVGADLEAAAQQQ